MRLAIEAIRVPQPPALTPAKSAWYSPVKLDSITAAGTLGMIWLARTTARYGRGSTKSLSASSILGIPHKFLTATARSYTADSQEVDMNDNDNAISMFVFAIFVLFLIAIATYPIQTIVLLIISVSVYLYLFFKDRNTRYEAVSSILTEQLIIDSNIWMDEDLDVFFKYFIKCCQKNNYHLLFTSEQLNEIEHTKNRFPRRVALRRIEHLQKIGCLIVEQTRRDDDNRSIYLDPIIIRLVRDATRAGQACTLVTNDRLLRIRVHANCIADLRQCNIFSIDNRSNLVDETKSSRS